MPVTPATSPGTGRLRVVPSPSRPSLFEPQQDATPAVVRPQLYPAPALTRMKVSPPTTATGGHDAPPDRPPPSWPAKLPPKPSPARDVVPPQVCVAPPPTPVKSSPPAT